MNARQASLMHLVLKWCARRSPFFALTPFLPPRSFYINGDADPGSIFLFKSGSTVITAFLLRFFLRRHIAPMQWAAIMMQVFGLVVVQWNPCEGVPLLSNFIYCLMGFSTCCTAFNAVRVCTVDEVHPPTLLVRWRYTIDVHRGAFYSHFIRISFAFYSHFIRILFVSGTQRLHAQEL
jgi:hypothetical protein